MKHGSNDKRGIRACALLFVTGLPAKPIFCGHPAMSASLMKSVTTTPTIKQTKSPKDNMTPGVKRHWINSRKTSGQWKNCCSASITPHKSIRIARAGGIPAAAHITQQADRLKHLGSMSRHGEEIDLVKATGADWICQ